MTCALPPETARSLAAVSRSLVGEWGLTPDPDEDWGRSSHVVPVRTADGVPAVLKVAAAMGEGPMLSDEEWPALLRTVVGAADDKAAIVCGLHYKDTKRTIEDAKRAEERRSMVKSGDRSDKVRTYNFPQDRLTDHRIGLTVHGLPRILSGELGEVITALRTHHQTEALQSGA